MPNLIRFLIAKFTNGSVLGLVVALAILRADFAEIARLIAASGNETALTLLSFAQAALLFGTLGMSVAVMNADAEIDGR
jgi:hypothetical protein